LALSAIARPSTHGWILATWLGWLLGIPTVALLALGAEAVGLGGLQVFVGAGMGLGVGLLQARIVRRFGVPALRWIAATTGGLALPFLMWDFAAAAGTAWTYQLAACVATGGLMAGIAQAVLLRHRLAGSVAWVLPSILGWGLSGVLATAGDLLLKRHAIRGVAGALLYLALMALPGGVLGFITGRALRVNR
jgi:hypothetical protein